MIELAIIGAGASGLMLAYSLSKNKNIHIHLFERSEHIGKKILVTGNGRCNLTNMNLRVDGFNTDKINELITKYDPTYIRNIFKDLGIKTIVDEEGRVYPFSLTATSITQAFVNKINDASNIEVHTSSLVSDIKIENGKYVVHFNYNELPFDKVVLCCGGVASGGTDFVNVLNNFNVEIKPFTPGLVPLETFEKTISLSGLRCKARVSVNDFSEVGEVLFKDNGLSGIVIMNASRHLKCGDIVHLDLSRGEIFNSLEDLELNLPKMVAHEIISRANNDTETALRLVEDLTFTVKSKYAFKYAHIMMGGVSLDEINLKNFELNKAKNIYVLGEALDVDGMCGGYNLHFAWASALALGDFLNESCSC